MGRIELEFGPQSITFQSWIFNPSKMAYTTGLYFPLYSWHSELSISNKRMNVKLMNYIGFNCYSLFILLEMFQENIPRKPSCTRSNLYTIEFWLNKITKHFSFMIKSQFFIDGTNYKYFKNKLGLVFLEVYLIFKNSNTNPWIFN